jgi:hypothetical protein
VRPIEDGELVGRGPAREKGADPLDDPGSFVALGRGRDEIGRASCRERV